MGKKTNLTVDIYIYNVAVYIFECVQFLREPTILWFKRRDHMQVCVWLLRCRLGDEIFVDNAFPCVAVGEFIRG